MPQGETFILMGVGGLFVILGLVGLLRGRGEEKGYYNSLSARTRDLREFVEHLPQRPQPGALKIGGWIAITIGVLLLATGVAFWLLS